SKGAVVGQVTATLSMTLPLASSSQTMLSRSGRLVVTVTVIDDPAATVVSFGGEVTCGVGMMPGSAPNWAARRGRRDRGLDAVSFESGDLRMVRVSGRGNGGHLTEGTS